LPGCLQLGGPPLISVFDALFWLTRPGIAAGVTATGVLTYNTICDSHLNKIGSLCVAGILAAALGSEAGPP
jgi:hypothetical protein